MCNRLHSYLYQGGQQHSTGGQTEAISAGEWGIKSSDRQAHCNFKVNRKGPAFLISSPYLLHLVSARCLLEMGSERVVKQGPVSGWRMWWQHLMLLPHGPGLNPETQAGQPSPQSPWLIVAANAFREWASQDPIENSPKHRTVMRHADYLWERHWASCELPQSAALSRAAAPTSWVSQRAQCPCQ